MGWVVAGGIIFVLCAVIGAVIGWMMLGGTSDMFDTAFGLFAGLGLGGLAGFLLAIFPVSWGQTHYNERTVTCHVNGKDRGGKEDDMRIYTSCGTFQNTDSILRGKNTSADVYGRIKVNSTQKFTVVGWRLGLTSDFPNILEVK